MASPTKEVILIIDDDFAPRRALALIAKQAGYRTFEAATASKGLELVAEKAPDLVLLDVRLPDQSGTDILEEICTIDSELPVVIITAYATVETAVAAINRGAASYIVKPIDTKKLLITLERLLERRRLRLENQRLYREMQLELRARRRAEDARDMLTQAVEAVSEAIIVTDRKGLILYANPGFETLTGHSASTVIGRELNDFEREHLTSNTRSNDGAKTFDKKNRIECSVTPMINSEGQVQWQVHVWRDVTEQRRLESIAQSVNVLNNIGYVFSGIRHELGNPVNSIQMTLKMIETKIVQGDFEGAAERVCLARSELEKIQFLLRGLRSFSMYERMEIQTLELSPFVEQFQRLVSADCDLRGVTLRTSVTPRDLRVRTDPRALQQVLLNVLTNTLDASEKVDQGLAELTVTGNGERVTLQLDDNGVGLTREAEANLFRPFVTTKPHGTGLGLVIAKKMMTQMGGTIEVLNRSQQGTRVILTLAGGQHHE